MKFYKYLFFIPFLLICSSCSVNKTSSPNIEQQASPRKVVNFQAKHLNASDIDLFIKQGYHLIILGKSEDFDYTSDLNFNGYEELKKNYKFINKAGFYILVSFLPVAAEEIASNMASNGFENIYWLNN